MVLLPYAHCLGPFVVQGGFAVSGGVCGFLCVVINTCPLVAVSRKEDIVSMSTVQAKHITP